MSCEAGLAFEQQRKFPRLCNELETEKEIAVERLCQEPGREKVLSAEKLKQKAKQVRPELQRQKLAFIWEGEVASDVF